MDVGAVDDVCVAGSGVPDGGGGGLVDGRGRGRVEPSYGVTLLW